MPYSETGELVWEGSSSWITGLTYSLDTGILTMQVGGREYDYRSISEGEAREWMDAPSAGRYWHAHIQGRS